MLKTLCGVFVLILVVAELGRAQSSTTAEPKPQKKSEGWRRKAVSGSEKAAFSKTSAGSNISSKQSSALRSAKLQEAPSTDSSTSPSSSQQQQNDNASTQSSITTSSDTSSSSSKNQPQKTPKLKFPKKPSKGKNPDNGSSSTTISPDASSTGSQISEPAACPSSANQRATDLKINELRVRRIDFVELIAEPETNLDNVWVLSIYHNGTVRIAIDLSGYKVSKDGYFFLSEHNDTINGEKPNMVNRFFAANSRRHSTIMLVCNYDTGKFLPFGEPLDPDQDCKFNTQPWEKELDSVSLKNNRKNECVYSTTVLNSENSRCYCHIYRVPDKIGHFKANPKNPFGRASPLDSPGAPNPTM